jgi:hypothetical protein
MDILPATLRPYGLAAPFLKRAFVAGCHGPAIVCLAVPVDVRSSSHAPQRSRRVIDSYSIMLRGRPYIAGPVKRPTCLRRAPPSKFERRLTGCASHKVLFPSAYVGRCRAGRYGEGPSDPASVLRLRSAAEERWPTARAALAVLRLRNRRAALCSTAHVCNRYRGLRGGTAINSRRNAAAYGSCAAGSFQNGGVPLPACGRHTAWSETGKSRLPDSARGIFALRSFDPARGCRDVFHPSSPPAVLQRASTSRIFGFEGSAVSCRFTHAG